MKRFFKKNEAEVYTSIGLLLTLQHFLSNASNLMAIPQGLLFLVLVLICLFVNITLRKATK
jgi:hypothetical protein